jgi:hypothetical protein
MPTRKGPSRACRPRRIVRGARRILFPIAEVFATVAAAPLIPMVVFRFGRLSASDLGARVERLRALP